uniref:Translation initiation factor eIF2B subunit epsilon n=1 Tax=Anthurium amnicola TaxID=1678845 RepID=A0A1D1Y333_9ARAE
MSQRRGSRASGDDPDELARVPLQAVLLADSFTQKFQPITLERPKVLLPLVNVPMIEYSMTWLESVGVKEFFVFCCAHAKQVKDHLEMSGWLNQPRFSVTTIESQDSISAGDALRVIYNKSVIRGDFILISGDTVSNACLRMALEEHKERRKKDPQAIMTMLVKHAKPSYLTHQTRLGNDEIFMAIDPETKQLLHYEDKADDSKAMVSLDKTLLSDNYAFRLHNDKQDCYIDICSQEVLSLFTDNFDYQHLRRHFVKGLLVDDIMGYKIFTHEIHGGYAARVDNFRSYDTVSKDILQRWTYPLVPNVQFSWKCGQNMLDREGIYRAPVVGEGCVIGHNVLIENSYIWDNVTIENDCKISHAIVCDGALLKVGAVLEPGVILSFKVVVGHQRMVPAYSKVSLCPQPSIQDSDEELEYADANTTSLVDTSIAELASITSEDGISGHGIIWSATEGGNEEEWRHSVAPIPAEKLMDFSVNLHSDPDLSSQDAGTLASREMAPELESTDSSDGDNENHKDVDFDGEVDATFRRAVDEGIDEENVILEVNSLKLAYNVEHTDCAGALFYAMMKLALSVPHSAQIELLEKAKEVIEHWKSLLKHYMRTIDEEVEVILKFEEMCLDLESTTEFSPLFTRILVFLYDQEILSEDAIIAWAKEKEGADESDRVLLRQAESFIQWLEEAEVEE